MKDNHKAVLAALALKTDPLEQYAYFRTIGEAAEIADLKEVRRIVRHLARRGYAHYRKGLWTEDGDVAGAGYCITMEGLQALGEALK